MHDVLYRNSANLLIVEGLVDWHDRDAQGKPTPVTEDVLVWARVYAPDRATPLSDPIPLLQETDQPQNYYRGVVPKTDFDDHVEVSVKFWIDGGGDAAYLERWKDCKVADE